MFPHPQRFFSTTLGCALLMLCLLAHQAVAEITNNGSFESFSGGLPTGWAYTQGDGPAVLQDTTTVSPFTNVYGASTASLAWSDGATSVATPSLQQTFAVQAGLVSFGFDFRISSFSTQPWLIVGQSTSALNFNNIRIAESGQFRLTDGSGATATPLTLNTWYQVAFLLDFTARTYTSSLTPFGGSATTFGTRSMFSLGGGTSNLTVVRISDSFGATSDVSAGMWVDNVTVVPEPGALGLGALGVLMLAGIRRRRR